MKLHSCGAVLYVDATADGLFGMYDPSGNLRLLIDPTDTGLYGPSGSINAHDVTAEVTPQGLISSLGFWNVTIVDGSTFVGMISDLGSLNVILDA